MSATSVGQIGLDLVVNKNQFESQMAGINGMAKKAGAALAAAFGVKKLVDFGKQCLELGSDLAEVQNVVDVTFPKMTAQVDEFARSAAQSFGLSETMAKQYTGTFGAMAKAFGFTERQAYDMGSTLTGLAGDVASFYNISQDEAYTKLKSVFTGETESLKDLGVVMTQTALDSYAMANGFGKTTSAMSEAEKVALRYQFVQDKLSAAQGDFARTSGSWANQCRILSLQMQSLMATIGQGLINLFTPIIRVINTVIGKLATLANAFKSFTELITGNKSSGSDSSGVAAVAGAADDAGTGLENASDSASNLASNTDKVGQAAQNAAKKMKALMGFDKVNKLDSQSDSSSGSSSSPSTGTGGTGALGSAVDFGNLAEGDTVLDKTDKKMSALIKRCQELAKLFKKGFEIGFGNSQKKIDSINESVKSIGKNLKEVFTDSAVVNAANRCVNNIALAFGKITGSTARIGLTLADNLVGGVDKYLAKSKNYIKNALFQCSMRQERLQSFREISVLHWQISLIFFQVMMRRESLQISFRYFQMVFLEQQIWRLNSKEILYHFLLFRLSRIQIKSPELWRICFPDGELYLMHFHRVLQIRSKKLMKFMISIFPHLWMQLHKASQISKERFWMYTIRIFHRFLITWRISSALCGQSISSRHWMGSLN